MLALRLSFFVAYLLGAVSLASAQLLITSTLPYDEGDTVAYSAATNAAGAVTYVSLSVVVSGAAAVPTPTTTARSVAAATTPRVVGQNPTQDSSVPQTTFVYTTNGQEVTDIFTPSFAPTPAPAEPPAGTVLGYSEYAAAIAPSLVAQASSIALARQSAGLSGASSRSPTSPAVAAVVAAGAAVVAGGAWLVAF